MIHLLQALKAASCYIVCERAAQAEPAGQVAARLCPTEDPRYRAQVLKLNIICRLPTRLTGREARLSVPSSGKGVACRKYSRASGLSFMRRS